MCLLLFFFIVVWHLSHQLSILSMNPCHGSDVFAGLQCLVELSIPQHHQVFIGHEHLEGVHPVLPNQGLHLVTDLVVEQQ